MNVNTYNYNPTWYIEEEEKYLGISLVYILVQFKAWSSAAIIYIEKKKLKVSFRVWKILNVLDFKI